MANKTRLTVTVDQKIEERITSISKDTLVPKSALVNKILSEYIGDMYPVEAEDIDYEIGDNGSVIVTYQDVDYSFSIQEGYDTGNEDYGERYIEITDETNNQPLEPIYNAYNINSIDDVSIADVSKAIKEEIANRIIKYLHSKD